MTFEVDLNTEHGTKTIHVPCCVDMDDCIEKVHQEYPDTMIEFIGVQA